jgi:hypothetical protein
MGVGRWASGDGRQHLPSAAQPGHIPRVPLNLPPYAVPPTEFRFPALAALAGRAQLGVDREIALATYLAARLVQDAGGAGSLSEPARVERASTARTWLSTLSLPAPLRASIGHLIESTAAADTSSLADDLRAVVASVHTYLDIQSRAELQRLVDSVGAKQPLAT